MPSGIYKHRPLSEKEKDHLREINLGKKRPNISGSNHYLYGKHHSIQTKKKMSLWQKDKPKLNQRGNKSHFWRGGITVLNKSIRSLLEYDIWRTSVFKRDNYTCIWCGIKNVNLNADHIKPFYLIIKDNNIKSVKKALLCKELWDINNGRTLCEKCHSKTDSYKGKNKMI